MRSGEAYNIKPEPPVADSLPTIMQQSDSVVAVINPEKSELELLRAALLENKEKLKANEAAIQHEAQKRLQRVEVDASKMKQLTSEARELNGLIDSIKKQIAVLQVVQPEEKVEFQALNAKTDPVVPPLNLPESNEYVASSARFKFQPPRVAVPMSPADVAKLPLGSQLPYLEKMHGQSNSPSERAELAAKIAQIKTGLSNHTLFASPLAEAFLAHRPSAVSCSAGVAGESTIRLASSLRR